MLRFLLPYLLLLSAGTFAQPADTELFISLELQKADLQYLRDKLESLHPNLYLYSSKQQLDSVLDKLQKDIVSPSTAMAFYRHITVLSSFIKDGHTVMLPSGGSTAYHNVNSKFLPCKIRMAGQQLFVDDVFSSQVSLPTGAELLSINGITARDIIQQMTDRQLRDGNNLTYPAWILNNYFREYYSYIFGHPQEFNIQYKDAHGTSTVLVNALKKDSINYYRNLKQLSKPATQALSLSLSPGNNYGILTIKDFHAVVLRKQYHQKFKKLIPAFFEELNNRQVKDLILDLRDNQGGDIAYGVLLLSYLMDKPFTAVSGYSKVDNANPYSLKACSGSYKGEQLPRSGAFKGRLIVLTNGGSFSNSGIVAACLKRNKRATFIGEETGGNEQNIAGYVKTYYLPNSKIHVDIPTRRFILDNRSPLSGHGTIPDYFIPSYSAAATSANDSALSFAIHLLQ